MKREPDLSVRFAGLRLKSPVTVASGTFGTMGEYRDYVDFERLGAIITKTITLRPRAGNPMPRICETTGGMLNAIGLQNKGLDDFLQVKIPFYRKIRTPLIVNIAAESNNDFRILSRELEKHKKVVKAIELNLSCPNVDHGGTSRKRRALIRAVEAARKETSLPLIAKLSPELGDVLQLAGDVLKAGAEGLSLINTLKGLAIDIEARRPRLANVTGGLSGPAIKPVALRYVYEVRQRFDVPVIASGGIISASDAVEFLLAGASLIAVGTANFVRPSAAMEILDGLQAYCREHSISKISQLGGMLCLSKQT